jgi:uncharacterized protein YjbI with pentapeptide repeats
MRLRISLHIGRSGKGAKRAARIETGIIASMTKSTASVRTLLLGALFAFLSVSAATAASFQRTDGSIVDPIPFRNGDGDHPYNLTLGGDLEPGANLSSADLFFADLTSADLTEADLTSAILTRVDLIIAKLTGANLSRADLADALLNGADLSSAILTDANLVDAILNGANLTGAILTDANLTGAHLFGARLPFANLRRTQLVSAELTGADFSDADLTNANLTDADLSRANLVDALLVSADLTGANLTDADFSDANLTDAINLSSTTITLGLGAPSYNANTNFTNTDFDPVAAGWIFLPEPATAALQLTALLGLAWLRRRAGPNR